MFVRHHRTEIGDSRTSTHGITINVCQLSVNGKRKPNGNSPFPKVGLLFSRVWVLETCRGAIHTDDQLMQMHPNVTHHSVSRRECASARPLLDRVKAVSSSSGAAAPRCQYTPLRRPRDNSLCGRAAPSPSRRGCTSSVHPRHW